MKRRRQAIKARNIQNIKDKQLKRLYRETEKLVRETNKRLNSLERYHASGTWSTGKLKTRIRSNKTKGLLYKGKRIKLKPKMTKTNLVQIQKATRQFLDSATSTNRGINKIKKETIKSLKNTLNLDRRKGNKISDKDMEAMYDMLSNKDFDRFNKSTNKEEYIGASAMWSEIDYASRNNLSEEDFITRLQNLRMQDFSLDEQEAARRIFEMYVL